MRTELLADELLRVVVEGGEVVVGERDALEHAALYEAHQVRPHVSVELPALNPAHTVARNAWTG